MTVVFIRTVILYFFILFAVRITGKRQIGELSPAELAVTLLMSELAALPMEDMRISLFSGIVPIAVLIALEFLLSLITLKCNKIRSFLGGNPVPIIEDGVINQKNMAKIKLTLDELEEEMRLKGVFDLFEVEQAIMETNGKLSILKKPAYQPQTTGNMKENLAVTVISDGEFLKDVAEKRAIAEAVIRDKMEKQGLFDYKDVFLMSVCDGEYRIVKKEKKK